ncbi:MAG: hypothetical protein E2O51_03385 [Gammaproteobacteria bacterium]|nr:MAG: hypothetical protein E2O51_03385 [Gammaproteobacteria bacterium]
MTIREIALGHAGRPGALLPAPTRDPGADGIFPDTAVPVVAEVLNLSRAELDGLINIHDLYRTEPPGAQILYRVEFVIHNNRGEVQLSTVTKQGIAPLPAPQ